MKKAASKIVLGVVVLLVVLIGVAWLMIDHIAKAAIEQGGTRALGVQTRVADVDLSLLGGRFQTQGLRFDNPQGFTAPFLMDMANLRLAVVGSSVFGETIQVNEFAINGLEMNIEQTLQGNNVSVVMDNVKKLSSGEAAAPGTTPAPVEKKEPGKKVKVDHISIRDVVANVVVALPAQQSQKFTIKVPQIELNDVTSDSASGVGMADLTRRVFLAVVAAVLKEGQGTLPPFMTQDLSAGLSSATQAVGGQAQKMLQDVQGQVQGQAQQVQGEVQKQSEAATQEFRKGFEGILKKPK